MSSNIGLVYDLADRFRRSQGLNSVIIGQIHETFKCAWIRVGEWALICPKEINGYTIDNRQWPVFIPMTLTTNGEMFVEHIDPIVWRVRINEWTPKTYCDRTDYFPDVGGAQVLKTYSISLKKGDYVDIQQVPRKKFDRNGYCSIRNTVPWEILHTCEQLQETFVYSTSSNESYVTYIRRRTTTTKEVSPSNFVKNSYFEESSKWWSSYEND